MNPVPPVTSAFISRSPYANDAFWLFDVTNHSIVSSIALLSGVMEYPRSLSAFLHEFAQSFKNVFAQPGVIKG
jgi:hypothetical protein